MSVRKCSACGNTTKGEVPFCSSCGALFPPGDESELMRQAVGYSFDLKWVLLGAITALVLQFGLLGGLWSLWGNKIIVGEKGRSLLQVNLEAINPQWGPNTGGTYVRLGIRPDSKGKNTARDVLGVYFGGMKSTPFHVQHLGVMQVECKRHCANRLKAQRLYRQCIQGCDAAQLKTEEKRIADALKPCFELEEKKNKEEIKQDKYDEEFKKAKCELLAKQGREFNKLKDRCEDECPKKKSLETVEDGRCKSCQKQMPIFEKRASDCQKDVSKCWSYFESRGKVEMPKESAFKSKKEYEKAKADAIKLDKRYRAAEQKELRNTVHVYTPKLPAANRLVPVKIIFRSGEELVKRQGFAYAKPSRKDRPAFKKTKHKLHDPVRTLGFWLLLTVSALFYLLGGFILGRLSPGIGTKEPFTAGLIGWLVFEVVLIVLGTAGTAQLFTIFIGAPLFIGCTMLGAILADRSLGYG